MWYWIIMFLLAAGCAGMLAVTFMSIKKQKAEKTASRRRGRRASGAAARGVVVHRVFSRPGGSRGAGAGNGRRGGIPLLAGGLAARADGIAPAGRADGDGIGLSKSQNL